MGTGWFKNAIVYHILIDRFAGYTKPQRWDRPEFIGGNLRGIIDKLGYIRDLGANTIWLSPFCETSAYHGYHVTDFFKVDPHFGTLDDLNELIGKAHAAGIKIIADFVPNHCSREHRFFKAAQADRTSDYFPWFTFKKWPRKYLCFLSFSEIPKLNLQYPPARRHIIDAAKYWLSLGIDGFRLDHCIGPTHDFWQDFQQQIKADYPDCVLIGEAWLMGIRFRELNTINVRHKYRIWLRGQAPEALYKDYIGELDGVLDFKCRLIMEELAHGKIDRDAALAKCQKHIGRFPPDFYLATFLDNHDMDRFLFISGQDTEKLKQAAGVQFSLPGPKIIYYGTETGLTQEKTVWDIPANGDLQARRPMDWENQDKELLELYKKLIPETSRCFIKS
ncbi:MAG: alpha-amylase family glycosyl hydrolase [Phycisphaerae bacterium]|nr:alpha-amylase family glycosyl hydrolase [Phycisphaerae bacterium]